MLRIVCFVGILCTSAPAQWITNPATGNQYKLLQPTTWAAAEATATTMGAHLVVIDDAAENQWIAANFLIFPCYIGGQDIAFEGLWSTPSGWPLDFTNWAPNQPDNHLGSEDHLEMWTANPVHGVVAGMWNDSDGLALRHAIIEKPIPQAVPYGSGCPGTNGAPLLTQSIGSLPPTPGATVDMTVDNLPSLIGLAFGVLALDDLAAPLAAIGMPGCIAHVDLESANVEPLFYIGTSLTWSFPVPNLPLVRGRKVFAQALVLDPTVNTFGATTTNGLELRIGF